MKYAIVNNERKSAEPNLTGYCPCCKSEVISKCGSRKIWHWSHKSKKSCDSFYKPETEWHRKWKNFFPIDWQESVMQDPITGEKHIADILLPNGVVIEFQNSQILEAEINARERFYKKMIWVINAEKFVNNLYLKDENKLKWNNFPDCWKNSTQPKFLHFTNHGPVLEKIIHYNTVIEIDKITITRHYKPKYLIWIKKYIGWQKPFHCKNKQCFYIKNAPKCKCGADSYNCDIQKVFFSDFIYKYKNHQPCPKQN